MYTWEHISPTGDITANSNDENTPDEYLFTGHFFGAKMVGSYLKPCIDELYIITESLKPSVSKR